MSAGERARRALDVAVAASALVALAPLLAAIALGVRLGSGGPALFKQARVGLGGRPFVLLKFRTMRPGAAGPRITPAGDRRVTRLGAWLRRTKLDELPQLLNVLRGDMSLIGPRPEMPEYLAHLGPAAADYAAVRPGLADAATLAFYDEADRMASAGEPERYYLETILPAKARVSVAYASTRTWRSDLRLVLALGRRVVAGVVLLVLLLVLLAPVAARARSLLVVAPHPDDEVLAAAGIMRSAAAAGDDVRVVVVTNGDFAGTEEGLVREGESVEALGVLGLPESRVVFLGYPDGVLRGMWNEAPDRARSYLAPTTGRQTTYGTRGFGGADFRTVLTGEPAPYNRPALVDDLRLALERFRPTDVVVTGQFDEHPDHRLTYFALRDALRLATGADDAFRPVLHTTIVHEPASYPYDDFWRAGAGHAWEFEMIGDEAWPNPSEASGVPRRFDPTMPFDMPPSLPRTMMVWSARTVWPVPPAMTIPDFDTNLKIRALRRYATQASDVLWSHAKADEFTWAETVAVGRLTSNIAGAARVTVSSARPGQPADALSDGVVDGAPVHAEAEWVAAAGGPAWMELRWRAPALVDRIRLFDRVGPDERLLAARVILDGGPATPVPPLANDGRGDDLVLPAPRRVTTLTVALDQAAGAPGLAEVEVFGELPPGSCLRDDVCDDGSVCTADRCRGGECVHEPVGDGTACGDADACNGVEVCAAGACGREPAPSCDDVDPCTTDTCESPGRCAHTFACAPVPARGPARCQLAFVGLPPASCEDGDPACDGDRTTDGTCRFDVVLCVGAARTPECSGVEPATAVAVRRDDRTGLSALAALMGARLPSTTGTCVGPMPVRVALHGRRRRAPARVRVPIRVTTAGGQRLRARVRLACHAAPEGVARRPPGARR